MISSRFRACACALVLASAWPLQAAAQTVVSPDPTPSPRATAGAPAAPAAGMSGGVPPEIGHVSTSDRHDEPAADAARPTYVVTRAQIDARGDRTVAQALEQTPGMQLFRYGAFGAQVSYGIRGATAEQTLVLLDGEPLANESSGSIDLGTLSTVGVARIEVVESGTSTLYGTSAVGGVINIITGVPRATYLEISGGSYGDANLRVSQSAGGFGVAFERHIAGNAYGYPALSADAGGVRGNADAQQSSGRLTYDGAFGRGWRARAEAGLDEVGNGVPGDLDFGATPAVRQNVARSDVRAELAQSGAHGSIALTFAGSRQLLGYNDPSNGGETVSADGRSQVSLRGVLDAGSSTLVGGVDLGRLAFASRGNPATLPDFDAQQSQSAAYLQETLRFRGGSQLYAGLRGERDSPLGSVAAPSFGGIFAAGAIRLKANVGESFRVPTFDELYYPGFGNPALLPERARNADVTLEAPNVGGGSISLGWFGREAANLIETVAVPAPTPSDPAAVTFAPQNAQRASIAGIVLTGRTRPLAGGVIGTLGVTDLYRALDVSPGSTPVRLTFEPVYVVSASLERPVAPTGFGWGADARVQGSHAETPGGALGYGTTTIDAFVRVRVAPLAIASLRVRNALNERDEPISGYPAIGRTVELELSTR